MARTSQLAIPLFQSTRSVVGISAVERETGVPKDTLRAWEKRYGFPQPLRDNNGERVYTAEQIHKLRLLRQLTERGVRPSKIISLPLSELEAIGAQQCVSIQTRPELESLLEQLHEHNVFELRRQLAQLLMRQGLHAFVLETVAPMSAQIAALRLRGDLELFEERSFHELAQATLRGAIHAIQHEGHAPRVLLAGLPTQGGPLPLLMMEALLCVGGAICISLGIDMPARDLALAAGAHRAEVVALALDNMSHDAYTSISELRSLLPPGVSLWIKLSGNGARGRKCPKAVNLLSALDGLPDLLLQWRREHATH